MAKDKAYREAKQRIEQARQSGENQLDLSGLNLTELPESLGGLTQLRSLDLGDNELTVLPEWLGGLTQLQSLDLGDNELTVLPEWLGGLTQLQSLNLDGNPLTALPEWLGGLAQLQSLSLGGNPLTALPEWLGGLTQLQSLSLWGNQLTALPESLGGLAQLQSLSLWKNQLTALPEWLGRLTQLQSLGLGGNPLTALPESLGGLTQLQSLGLSGNQLTALPESLGRLTQLKNLDLAENPLNPDLAAAYEKGLDAVGRYLRELAKGAGKRYEAKLLILGDGNEGKTCVSRALRDLPFCQQQTTRGVDVVQWTFAHPDDAADRAKQITLNIWDFEGQEISHQTHQFFLTSQAMYLLVFKCRDQFLIERAEYWLDTIRARAPGAKVALVITQCEERFPLVPLDRIQSQYGDLLAPQWFFPVGCEDGSKIPQLRAFLQRWAADLKFMGTRWPASYAKAETAIKAKANDEAEQEIAHITRGQLYEVFAKAGVSGDGYEDAAAAMSRLGVITQFPDCPDLRDFVVLRPQWLTKAISKVMEDKDLSNDQGEIALQRMQALWDEAGYAGMFTKFHNCMKQFELCYDLEDDHRGCLVPLRFGYLRPEIPWTDAPGWKQRRVQYKLNLRPPMGIMSRFIVKTHHMIATTQERPQGVYWHNGVFLRTGEGSLRSEALCEFVPEDRTLRVEVRAAYPQNLCEQIHAYVKAVFSFFSGLEAERSYGCINVDPKTGAETECTGMHTEKRIYTAIARQRPTIDCEFEEHEIDPRVLIGGFGSFSEFVEDKMVSRDRLRQELDMRPAWAAPFLQGVGTLLDWVKDNGGKIDQLLVAQAAQSAEFKQEAELKLHEYLALTSQLLDDREFTAAPGIFSLHAKDRSLWNPTTYFTKSYVLTPYCECMGNIHPCDDGQVEFTKDRDWWKKTRPWLARGTKVLSLGLQLAFAGMPLALGGLVFDAIKNDVKFMNELAKHVELKEGDKDDFAESEELFHGPAGRDLRAGDRESRLARAALAGLLEKLAPNEYRAGQWGSLSRVRMSDNSHRWLCGDCAQRRR